MKKNEKQALIKGVYKPDDAREIISTLFNAKINFHKVSKFSLNLRTGKDSPFDEKRAEELSNSLDKTLKIIKVASDNNLLLDIKCDVILKLKESA